MTNFEQKALSAIKNYIEDNAEMFARAVLEEMFVESDEDGSKWLYKPYIELHVWYNPFEDKWLISRYSDDYEDDSDWLYVCAHEHVEDDSDVMELVWDMVEDARLGMSY